MAKARKVRRARRGQALSRRPSTSRGQESLSLTEEYQYVVADLKRIFILAGVMLTLLIVLALVLP